MGEGNENKPAVQFRVRPGRGTAGEPGSPDRDSDWAAGGRDQTKEVIMLRKLLCCLTKQCRCFALPTLLL